jgi:thioredoxin 1
MGDIKMSEILNSANFEEKALKADKPALVDFFATWCGPCKRLAPILEELTGEVSEQAYVYKVDIDQSPDLAARYGVVSVPTLIVFRDGQPAAKMVGAQPKAAIMQMLR